jgi:hypothetical protein
MAIVVSTISRASEQLSANEAVVLKSPTIETRTTRKSFEFMVCSFQT